MSWNDGIDYESYIGNLYLPSCSFKFWYATSEWVLDPLAHITPYRLEEAIPGYRTHEVKGRDSLSSDINEIEYSHQHGAGYRRKRHQTRDLTISYGLTSNSVEHHRKQLDQMKGMLHKDIWWGRLNDASYGNAEQLYIVFDDEPDVFYKGAVSEISEEMNELNFSSTGEITIHCSDPHKYSLEKKVVFPTTVDDNTIFSLTYNGTVPASPEFSIEFHGDTGYAAFIDDWGHIIQIGDPEITGNAEEQKYDEQTKGVTTEIFNNYFGRQFYNIDDEWILNAYAADQWKYPIIAEGDFVTFGDGLYVADPSTYNYWHGPSLKRTFDPVDDFLLDTGIYLGKTKASDKATVCIDICIFGDYGTSTIERTLIRACAWSRYPNNYDSKFSIELDGVTYKTIDYQCTRDSKNKYTFGTLSNYYVPLLIERYKDLITIKIKDTTFSYMNAIPEGSRATGVGIHMYVLDDKFTIKNSENHNYVYGMGVRHARFYSLPVEWADIANKFVAYDQVDINCKTGSIKMNGGERPGLGALGNDFEDFKLLPGLNEIKIAWSEWCRSDPSPSLRYREVFL